jgi:hypothetical protein
MAHYSFNWADLAAQWWNETKGNTTVNPQRGMDDWATDDLADVDDRVRTIPNPK